MPSKPPASSTLTGAAKAGLPPVVLGALYLTACAAGLAAMNVLVRFGTDELDPLQVAFFRNAFALVVMMPWLATRGVGVLKTKRLGLHAWRAIFGLFAMGTWFYSVALLPLATTVSLAFSAPLFATVGAALILGELVRARRWTAVFVGFLGMLVILRPGFGETSLVMLLPISAAVFMAASILLVKKLSASENPDVMVFYMNLFLTPLSLIPALLVWQWPSPTVWGLMLLLGFFAVLSHALMGRAYAQADASAILPFYYFQLPFVMVLAFFFFAEVPDIWTVLGAAIIAGSALYIARRESRQGQKPPRAPGAAA